MKKPAFQEQTVYVLASPDYSDAVPCGASLLEQAERVHRINKSREVKQRDGLHGFPLLVLTEEQKPVEIVKAIAANYATTQDGVLPSLPQVAYVNGDKAVESNRRSETTIERIVAQGSNLGFLAICITEEQEHVASTCTESTPEDINPSRDQRLRDIIDSARENNPIIFLVSPVNY